MQVQGPGRGGASGPLNKLTTLTKMCRHVTVAPKAKYFVFTEWNGLGRGLITDEHVPSKGEKTARRFLFLY